MKLRFLGQVYATSNHRVKTVLSEHTARFLGQNYTPSLSIKPVKSQLGLRKYRGVIYGESY